MKIAAIRLYKIRSENTGERGAQFGESQYWGGGWQTMLQWCGGPTAARRIAAIAKPYGVPVIPHGSGVYNYHFVQSNLNSPFAEYLSVGDGTSVRPIFDAIVGEPLPVNGHVTLSDQPGFGVELNRDLIQPVEF